MPYKLRNWLVLYPHSVEPFKIGVSFYHPGTNPLKGSGKLPPKKFIGGVGRRTEFLQRCILALILLNKHDAFDRPRVTTFIPPISGLGWVIFCKGNLDHEQT